ncbi:hypothetical protein [Curtobacterium sp. ZW137]|uniref:hypothetical protein n=1 Tax=Curtobacterium sp. ZW137 TaxID=2485104 RepID=UPI000F4BFBA9|nr:hypothetical protein [Curtobacterium sp. ZW137]ROP65045.1 hypothetical protein EDF55_1698 [Curtobacterium sp. ZW137]
MTRTHSTIDAHPTRVHASYAYHPGVHAAPRPVRRAQVFPWWIWALSPLLTVGVVAAMLLAV